MNLYERRNAYNNKCVERLIKKFSSGVYDNNLFIRVMKLSMENAERFEPFLESNVPQIKIASIKILAKNVDDLSFLKRFTDDEDYVIETIVNVVSDREEYVDLMASLLNENSVFLSNMIMNIKKMGKEEYLTTLLFSDNDELVKFIKRIVE